MHRNDQGLANFKLRYLLFGLPFILGYISWRWLPLICHYIITNFIGYLPASVKASWMWNITVWFFYTWYVILSVVIGGILLVASWIWHRKKPGMARIKHFPKISFIVPAYNEERTISKCIASLFKCAAGYAGESEIIVVDDGSTDRTADVAKATFEMNLKHWPKVGCKLLRHRRNLGKSEAIRTGLSRTSGELVAIVDADTWWDPETLTQLVILTKLNGLDATTGYIHPSDGNGDVNLFVILQQLEYSQGLGIFRSAQALGNSVLVIPGPISLYKADVLKEILKEIKIQSVTEDLEITLEMHRRGYRIGYLPSARSSTIAPTSFKTFWNQRMRWFIGGLHNIVGIHRKLLFMKRWLSLLLWYCLITGYGGAIIELLAVFSIPLLYWFAPDRLYFLYNLLVYTPLILAIGTIYQASALKLAYNHYNHRKLLYYTPLYAILRFINVTARSVCLVRYAFGFKGSWKPSERPRNLNKN